MYVYINYDKQLNRKKCILWWDEYLFGMIHFKLIIPLFSKKWFVWSKLFHIHDAVKYFLGGIQ